MQPKEVDMTKKLHAHPRRAIWLAAAAGVAALAAIIPITVALATSGTSIKAAPTQRPAQTSSRVPATCAPDDSLPVGPGGEGVPACLPVPQRTTPSRLPSRR
jgi:hypothetical protein